MKTLSLAESAGFAERCISVAASGGKKNPSVNSAVSKDPLKAVEWARDGGISSVYICIKLNRVDRLFQSLSRSFNKSSADPFFTLSFLRFALASFALRNIFSLLASTSCFFITSTAYSFSSIYNWLKSSSTLFNVGLTMLKPPHCNPFMLQFIRLPCFCTQE
jgi:hypothetical protein